MLNVLTIDIEDYWSVFSRDWLGIDAEPSIAVLRNTEWFLETLKRFNVRATVFVLGEVAKKFLVLIKKIAGLSPRKFVASFPKFTTIWCIQRAIRYYWTKRCPIYNYTARQKFDESHVCNIVLNTYKELLEKKGGYCSSNQ